MLEPYIDVGDEQREEGGTQEAPQHQSTAALKRAALSNCYFCSRLWHKPSGFDAGYIHRGVREIRMSLRERCSKDGHGRLTIKLGVHDLRNGDKDESHTSYFERIDRGKCNPLLKDKAQFTSCLPIVDPCRYEARHLWHTLEFVRNTPNH
jgi:hypothetical protein